VFITGLKSVKNWEIERDECSPEKFFSNPGKFEMYKMVKFGF